MLEAQPIQVSEKDWRRQTAHL